MTSSFIILFFFAQFLVQFVDFLLFIPFFFPLTLFGAPSILLFLALLQICAVSIFTTFSICKFCFFKFIELHRFLWLEGDHKIGEIDINWNYLVGVDKVTKENKPKLKNIHWTLGGPRFKKQRTLGGDLAAKWFSSRDEAMKLWE